MNSKKLPTGNSSEMEKNMNDFFMLAHDIKSPVNQIRELLWLAKAAGSASEKEKILEIALNSSEKLSDKIQQILTFAANQQPDESKIDFTRLFESIKITLKNAEGFNKTKFITSIDDNISYYGNQVKLQSVFQNLIENAVKYRKTSIHQNIIIFTVHEARNSIIIKVADNGRGMKKDMLPKVFDKAFKGNSDDQGSGMGLYLVKKNLNEMGAYIEVESREGEGTTFTIELPNHDHEVRSMASA